MHKKNQKLMVKGIVSLILLLTVIAGLFSLVINTVKALNLQHTKSIEGVIVYIELDGDIYLYVGDTGERVQLTTDANRYRYNLPKFSPDGRHLAFLRTNPEAGESRFDLHVMDLTTKAVRRLVENVDEWGNYNWTPNSESIVYGYAFEKICQSPDQTKTYGIWQVQLETGVTQEIIPPRSPNEPLKSPVFSFDGRWMSFESFPCFSEGFQLHTMDLSNNQVYNFGFAEADWSPNHNRLALSQEAWAGGEGGVMLVTADQAGMQILQEAGNLSSGDPRWSPDGEWIAVRQYTLTDGMFMFSDEITSWEDHLVLIHTTGNQLKIVCSSEEIWGCRMIEWSPSGSQIIYTVLGAEKVDWYLYILSTGESINMPEFGDGGIDWMSSEQLPRIYFPAVEAGQQPVTTQPAASGVDKEPPTQQQAQTDKSPQEIPSGLNAIIAPWIFICGGVGLILLSVAAIIYFAVKRKK